MNDLKSRWGLLRSELIYLWKPFSRRRLRRFYSRFVQPGALCFDIGAHLGSRSRAFLDLGARVIALEPQPRVPPTFTSDGAASGGLRSSPKPSARSRAWPPCTSTA